MREEQVRCWYVLKTRPRQEKAVRQLLSECGIENYLPTHLEVHEYVNQRKKTIEVPLISSVCFMRCLPDERFDIVNALKYKTTLLTDRFTNSSMIIPAKQMADFMLVVSMMRHSSLEQVPFMEGDKVVVREGEFKGVEGVVSKVNGHKQFVITLNNLASFVLRIPMSQLQKID